jgi:hypothetical protein
MTLLHDIDRDREKDKMTANCFCPKRIFHWNFFGQAHIHYRFKNRSVKVTGQSQARAGKKVLISISLYSPEVDIVMITIFSDFPPPKKIAII